MQIVSCITDSFQEYEGYHSLVLFCQGCNLRCRECYNLPYIINPPENLDYAMDVLHDKLNPLHEAVVFLGGEPTIYPDLDALAQHVKRLELKTKVYTNGLNPDVIKRLNEKKLIDAYSVDFKTIDNTEILGMPISIDNYIKNVTATLDNIIENNISLEIRTTRWLNVDIEGIQKYLSEHYPQVKHIIQNKFEIF